MSLLSHICAVTRQERDSARFLISHCVCLCWGRSWPPTKSQLCMCWPHRGAHEDCSPCLHRIYGTILFISPTLVNYTVSFCVINSMMGRSRSTCEEHLLPSGVRGMRLLCECASTRLEGALDTDLHLWSHQVEYGVAGGVGSDPPAREVSAGLSVPLNLLITWCHSNMISLDVIKWTILAITTLEDRSFEKMANPRLPVQARES